MIKNTRIIFGPPRGHTTTVWERVRKDSNYFIDPEKEFNGYYFKNTVIKEDIYFKDYKEDKIYVDCGLVYFTRDTKSGFSKHFKQFSKDILIYNVRPFYEFIFSYFRVLFLVDSEARFEGLIDLILYQIEIEKFFLSLHIDKKYKGELCFIPSEHFNVDKIFAHYNLPALAKDDTVYNSSKKLLDWAPEARFPSLSRKEFNDRYTKSQEKLKFFIKENQSLFDEALKRNLEMFNKHENLFSFGKIDKEKYSSTKILHETLLSS